MVKVYLIVLGVWIKNAGVGRWFSCLSLGKPAKTLHEWLLTLLNFTEYSTVHTFQNISCETNQSTQIMISINGPTHFPPSFPPQVTLRTVEPRKVRSSQSTSSQRAPSVWTTRMSSLRLATRVTDQTLPHLTKHPIPAQQSDSLVSSREGGRKYSCVWDTVAPPTSHKQVPLLA